LETARAQPLSGNELLAAHMGNGGARVHIRTMTRTLKTLELVWKRTRHSLKKRNELAFRPAQVEIEELKKRALEGEMVLAYVDEVGFAKAHPNRGLWTLKGARHLIEAVRGARLNVMGAILSTGKVFQIKYWEKTTANIFGAFIVGLRNFVKNPITIILDNASIHKAKSAKNLIRFLKTEDGRTGNSWLGANGFERSRLEWHSAV
jgi:hypothetical protein